MADSTTNLDLISVSQSSKETTDNAISDAASVATYFGRRASTTTGLTWGYYGAVIPGSATRIANGTIALTGSATNYLYATAAGVVTKVTAAPGGWPNALAASAIAMYEIVTGSSSVTSYKDWRPGFAGSGGVSSVMTGDDGGSPGGGTSGAVPAPVLGDQYKYLAGNATFRGAFSGADQGSPSLANGLPGLVPAPVAGQSLTVLGGAGAWLSPIAASVKVVAVVFSATLTIDLTPYQAYTKFIFTTTLTNNLTLNFTNGVDGLLIEARLTQDGTGSRTFIGGANVGFSNDTPSPTLSITGGKKDILLLEWDATAGKAELRAVNRGY